MWIHYGIAKRKKKYSLVKKESSVMKTKCRKKNKQKKDEKHFYVTFVTFSLLNIFCPSFGIHLYRTLVCNSEF